MPAAHFFGDGCPAPHGASDAPLQWAGPGEDLRDVRARVGQPENPGQQQAPAGEGGGLLAGACVLR